MGAEVFSEKVRGRTAQEAFNKAVDEAAWEHGHGGYTGTIAEKGEFVMIEVPVEMDKEMYAKKLIEDDDERVDDKWGPAGCIDMGPVEGTDQHTFLFFGWASS